MNKELIKKIKEITSWTCWCNSITFDNGTCRLCGKSPRYGDIDYHDLIKLLNDTNCEDSD